jgi:pimeloyl-ACP methyl ester carboxylesterase
MMLFAEAHPDDVAGIVLIDSSHPVQQEAFADVPAMAAQQAADLAEIKALATSAEAGLLDATEVLPHAPDFLPPELQQQWADLTNPNTQCPHAVAGTRRLEPNDCPLRWIGVAWGHPAHRLSLDPPIAL